MKLNKPFPPYGKQLWTRLNQGERLKNDIFLFLGIRAWDIGKSFTDHQTILILPYGHDPDEFYWPVQYCSILAFNTDPSSSQQLIRKLAYTLLCSGATIVRITLEQGMVIYKRE